MAGDAGKCNYRIFVIFLLLVILLRSFVLPFIILLTIPVAGAGGIAGLAVLNIFIQQQLDMLTMLGFVILTGVVVNNAILMIEQTMLHLRVEGMTADKAIIEATRNRIRPIFMSTLTSHLGGAPCDFSGAGSELYRGIGVVVFGGLGLRCWRPYYCPTVIGDCISRFVSPPQNPCRLKHIDWVPFPTLQIHKHNLVK